MESEVGSAINNMGDSNANVVYLKKVIKRQVCKKRKEKLV